MTGLKIAIIFLWHKSKCYPLAVLAKKKKKKPLKPEKKQCLMMWFNSTDFCTLWNTEMTQCPRAVTMGSRHKSLHNQSSKARPWG